MKTGMTATKEEKQFWLEFMELYRDLPALWNMKGDEYKKRSLKDEAYENLVEKLQEFDPEATRTTVIRKINSLRTNYRRELKKVLSAEMSGKHFTSKLYYFETLSFIRDLETSQEMDSHRTMSENGNDGTGILRLNCDGGSAEKLVKVKEELLSRPRRKIKRNEDSEFAYDDQDNVSDNDTDAASPIDTGTRVSHPWKKRKGTDVENTSYEDLLNSLNSHSKFQHSNNSYYGENNDAIDVLAKSWAQEFYNLSSEQQIYARKGINDILFEGRLGTLHRHSIKMNVNEKITMPTPFLPTKQIEIANRLNSSIEASTIGSIVTTPDGHNFRIYSTREENKNNHDEVEEPIEIKQSISGNNFVQDFKEYTSANYKPT